MSLDPSTEKLLAQAHFRPSHDDLYGEFRNSMTKEQADVMASVIVALCDRILRLERALESSRRAIHPGCGDPDCLFCGKHGFPPEVRTR